MICFEHISRFKSRCKGPAASGSGMRSYSEHNPAAFIRKLACRMMHKTAGICPWHISRFKSRCKGLPARATGMRSASEHNPAAFIRKLACRMLHKTAGICPWHISRCVPLQGPPGEGHGNAQRERAYVTRILCCPIRFRTNLWWIPPEERRFLTHNACLH